MGIVQGIDVSHHQAQVDLNAVARGGTRFVFLKATEGGGYTDPTFVARWNALGRMPGMIRGAYHFGRPGSDPEAQAGRFLRVVGPKRRADLVALDLEADDGRNGAAVSAWALAFLKRVEDEVGHPPILYTGGWFWNPRITRPEVFARYPLWLSHYTSAPAPKLPRGFSSWAIWQFTSSGRVAGIPGNVDVNRCDELMLAHLIGLQGPESGPGPTPKKGRQRRMILVQPQNAGGVFLYFGKHPDGSGNYVPLSEGVDRDRILAAGVPLVEVTADEWRRDWGGK